jgi:hypothetical protein
MSTSGLRDGRGTSTQQTEAEVERRLQQELDTIQVVLPSVSREVAKYVYSIVHKCDLTATLEWFLEKGDADLVELSAKVAERAREEKCRQAEKAALARDKAHRNELERLEQEEQKKLLLAKYEYKEVLPQYKDNGEAFVKPIRANVFITVKPELGGGTPKTRYRDGQVVTKRGEKFVVEKKEEYDGGSRGKVMPKGKRGGGWIQS